METPHNEKCQIAVEKFLSDSRKFRRNTVVFQGIFVKNDGNFAGKMVLKALAVHCAVFPYEFPSCILAFFGRMKYNYKDIARMAGYSVEQDNDENPKKRSGESL